VLETALLANAASSLVTDYVERWLAKGRGSTPELPPGVLEQLERELRTLEAEDAPGLLQLSREAAKPDVQQTVGRTVGSDVGAAALAISPGELFRGARGQNRQVFLVGLVLSVALGSILTLGIAGVIVSAVFLGNGSAAAVFGGVAVLDVIGFALTKPFAVIQRASVTSQRLDLAYLRLQEQLKDCERYTDPDELFRAKSRVWDQTQEEFRALTLG
jgi:hypothetical protein